MELSSSAWLAIGVVGVALLILTFTKAATDIVLIAGVAVLLLSGTITTADALAGLSNEAMATVGVLFVVVAGLESTGATSVVVQRLLGRPRSLSDALARMLFPVAGVSAFLNNTPVVAMFMPAVNDWARKYQISASKLMIPLSYAAILGGVCTLIGTSTNIVVNGLVISSGYPSIGMWTITWVGVPTAIVGCLYLLLVGWRLLPDRKPVLGPLTDPREYTVEIVVDPGGPLVGKTIEEAGLRHLQNMYLAEVDRGGQVMPAVSPRERLAGGDRLMFVGVVESIVELQRIRGLIPATDQVNKLGDPRLRHVLVESVVSPACRAIGQTIREARFRNVYGAAVLAVARGGERINRKIGDISLRAGDTLLLEAPAEFVDRQRNSREFLLVSRVENSAPIRHNRAYLALGILLMLIIVVSFEWIGMLKAGMIAAGLMIALKCCSPMEARRTVDWQILLAIAASFALGTALEKTGAAKALAGGLISMAQGNPTWSLMAVYAAAAILTTLITNNAAAALMFPIALATAKDLNVDPTPFFITLMLGASASFATPISYQTNLMVMNAGGYRFSDYIWIGVPLNILLTIVAALLVPVFFPLKAL